MGRRVDLVSADYYTQSLQVDERMEATRNGFALGEALQVEKEKDAVVVTYRAGEPAAAAGRVRLYRSADATADRELPMALDADGRQRVSIAGLAPGAWRLQLEWQMHGRDYFVERALTLP
jgi:nitrogen fixation protein FixH